VPSAAFLPELNENEISFYMQAFEWQSAGIYQGKSMVGLN